MLRISKSIELLNGMYGSVLSIHLVYIFFIGTPGVIRRCTRVLRVHATSLPLSFLQRRNLPRRVVASVRHFCAYNRRSSRIWLIANAILKNAKERERERGGGEETRLPKENRNEQEFTRVTFLLPCIFFLR